MVTYEPWEMWSGNLVGSWATEAQALAAVRGGLDRHGAELVSTFSLLAEDARGNTTVVAEGATLIERARQSPHATDSRSA